MGQRIRNVELLQDINHLVAHYGTTSGPFPETRNDASVGQDGSELHT